MLKNAFLQKFRLVGVRRTLKIFLNCKYKLFLPKKVSWSSQKGGDIFLPVSTLKILSDYFWGKISILFSAQRKKNIETLHNVWRSIINTAVKIKRYRNLHYQWTTTKNINRISRKRNRHGELNTRQSLSVGHQPDTEIAQPVFVVCSSKFRWVFSKKHRKNWRKIFFNKCCFSANFGRNFDQFVVLGSSK